MSVLRVPADARELRFAGSQALQQGDAARALSLFDQALTLKEADFNTHYARHEALVALARVDDALLALARAIDLKPSFATARLARAQLRANKSLFDDALLDVNAVLADKATHPQALALLRKLESSRSATASASELAAIGDDVPCEQVMAPLSSAIAALPVAQARASIPLRLRRARCLAAAHDTSGVLDDTRRVLSIDPSNADALELRGHALYSLGEDEAASQHFNKCVRMNPEAAGCAFHWKRTRALHKALAAARDARARSAWAEVIAAVDAAAIEANSAPELAGDVRVPHDRVTGHIGRAAHDGGVHRAELFLLRCIGLAGQPDTFELALDMCEYAAQVNDADAEPLLTRAEVLRRLRRWDEAINDYNRAQHRDPNSRRAMHGKHDAERERKIATRKDYYKLLGVTPDVDMKEIKRAHRKMASQYHPDKCNDPAQTEHFEKIFIEIGEALEILGDEKKRKLYDEGADLEDIRKQEQHEQSQKNNPFGQQQGGFQGGFHWNF